MCDNKKKFVQIHQHTDASMLDGIASIPKLVKKAKEYGHPALAITDHGNAANLFSFSKECKKEGIKPILGLEFYICNDLRARVSNKGRELEDKDYHQSTYIKNKQGYKNFCELTYRSFTDGYYYKPRIDFDSLFELKEGLMITSSCMASKTSQYIMSNRHKDAEDLFKKFLLQFKEDFYGEIQFNEVKGQKEINDFIIHLCKKYDVPLLIGGDVHYVDPNDNVLQDAVIRSKRNSSKNTEDESNPKGDWTIDARRLYYHNIEDYIQFNKDLGYNYDEKLLEQCFENSIKFSEKPDFEFETGKYHLPKINTGELSSKEYLEKITWEGITKRIEKRRELGEKISNDLIEQYEKRIEYELKVIDDLGVADYLLIVQDIINWEKDNDLYVGPGRGSVGGSCVAYGIGLSELCPITHELIFERFINPQRKTYPDIDWDSQNGAREQILNYLIGKYGQESVRNVVTFGLYGPKSALQDMSRGLNKNTGHDSILMRKISKLPGLEDTKGLKTFFETVKRISSDKEVLEWIDGNQDTIDFAQRLQGQLRQLGTHAGGILVTPGPIYNYIPVTRGSGNIVSAFKEADGSGKDLSELGILKLDVLGLKTLNIFKECVQQIKKDTGVDLKEKIKYLDLTDKKIIEYFASGNNFGIFQMDRSKMFTTKIKVDCFEDIVAINAINRPGPLEKFLDKYGYWKEIDKGTLKITQEELNEINNERYPFDFMKKVLSKTYGTLLFQEQFMLLVAEAANFDMGEADNFRRGIAWREDNPKYHTVAKYFEKLEKGMLEKGYTKDDVNKFVNYCRDFMGYSFNAIHAKLYSYITWQTLFFKVYYPAYFYAAMINQENDIEVYQEIIADARKNGIDFLPHSISKSNYQTAAEGEKAVRLGYQMIKGLGEAACKELEDLKLNECTTIDEVLMKPFKKVNSTQLQNLIDLGCFDEFDVDRGKLDVLKELYQDEKIEFWFTRQKQALRLETTPPSLKEYFDPTLCVKMALKVRGEDQPHIALINSLISQIKVKNENPDKIKKRTIKKQTELLGFSLLTDNIVQNYERGLQIKGILPIKDYDDPDAEYYFSVVKKDIKLSQKGKEYLQLTLNDGVSDHKAKCWTTIELEEGKVYYGKFKKDNYGLTLNSKGVYSVD